jgi:hypothetical protein
MGRISINKLKVNSWGGFGSQLWVLYLIHDLKKKFLDKQIILVHHTSGITRRPFEIHSLIDPNIKINVIDDFRGKKAYQIGKHYIKINIFKRITKKLLVKFGILGFANTDQEFEKISNKILEIRGHYSSRTIKSDFLEYLSNTLITQGEPENYYKDSLIIHYRLGDLQNLPNKTFVASTNLINAMNEIISLENFNEIIVYSDSIDIARELLEFKLVVPTPMNFIELTTIELVKNSIRAKYFIGTSSKVSEWIITIREYLNYPSIRVR